MKAVNTRTFDHGVSLGSTKRTKPVGRDDVNEVKKLFRIIFYALRTNIRSTNKINYSFKFIHFDGSFTVTDCRPL